MSQKKVIKDSIRPTVSFIISCYNEENVIREKLLNTLSIDYPEDKFEIIVVSDASTDKTDAIVREFCDQGVKLIRQNKRLGKTAGLNKAVSQATGEMVIFSDANAMYEINAAVKLIENFADETVGYVVGEARYRKEKISASGKSEDKYWNYEIFIKKLESQIGSVVGGDGAIYSIRRKLWERLLHTDINDFVNPLQIIRKGYRGIYESEAICWEDTSETFSKEFSRKVRIVNRSFSGLLRVKSVLNPFKSGLFSIQVLSHKLLRWFSPFFLIALLITGFILSLSSSFFQIVTILFSLFILSGCAGYLFSSRENIPFVFFFPYYFLTVNIASMSGLYQSLKGDIKVTWEPVRVNNNTGSHGSSHGNFLFVMNLAVLVSICFFLISFEKIAELNFLNSKTCFFTSLFLITYVYFLYPILLWILSLVKKKEINKKNITPDVTLLICAYNEQDIIEKKIQNSFEIDYPSDKLKIFIASDGSSDETNKIIKKYTNDKLVLFDYPQRRGKINVLIDTIPNITSEIIVFSDANTMYSPDALKKIVRNFNDPDVGGVSADVILLNDETSFGNSESTYYKYERWVQQLESNIASIIGADGGMFAIRTKYYCAPSRNIILDDFVISMNVIKQGSRLIYEGEAKGYEVNVNSKKDEFTRKSRVVAGGIQALKQNEGIPLPNQRFALFSYGSHKLLRWFVPFFLIFLFISNIVIITSTIHSFYNLSFFLQSFFYFLAFIGIFSKGSIRNPIIYIPFYFCLVNSAALYGIIKGLFNLQPVTWKMFSRK